MISLPISYCLLGTQGGGFPHFKPNQIDLPLNLKSIFLKRKVFPLISEFTFVHLCLSRPLAGILPLSLTDNPMETDQLSLREEGPGFNLVRKKERFQFGLEDRNLPLFI
jgi:hypothetical protein